MPALDQKGAPTTQWYVASDEEMLGNVRPTIVTLARFLSKSEPYVGLLLSPDADLDSVAQHLGGIERIGVTFSTFKDGRPFSLGRLLRSRYGFRGDLRAYGPFIPDQGAFLVRCGFTSFDVVDGFDAVALHKNIEHFAKVYQRPHGTAVSIIALRQKQGARS
jgi:uncharacterized protein (DUF934 family)